MLVYILVVYTILYQRRHHKHFRSSFYTLFAAQFIADFWFCMHYELVMRPRKYRYFDLFVALPSSNFFPRYNYLENIYVRTVVVLGYIPFALNRACVFYRPLTFEETWNNRTVLKWVAAQYILPAVPMIICYFLFPPDVYFYYLKDGILQMYADDTISTIDLAMSVVAQSLAMMVCLICYVYTVICLHKRNQQATKTEISEYRLLFCAMASFVPLLLCNIVVAIRVIGIVSRNQSLFVLFADIGFFIAETMTDIPPWTLLIVSPTFRRAMLEALYIKKKSSEIVVLNINSSTFNSDQPSPHS